MDKFPKNSPRDYFAVGMIMSVLATVLLVVGLGAAALTAAAIFGFWFYTRYMNR